MGKRGSGAKIQQGGKPTRGRAKVPNKVAKYHPHHYGTTQTPPSIPGPEHCRLLTRHTTTKWPLPTLQYDRQTRVVTTTYYGDREAAGSGQKLPIRLDPSYPAGLG